MRGLCIVTSDEDPPNGLSLPNNLRVSWAGKGGIANKTIWWIGYAKNDKEALRECRRNWRRLKLEAREAWDELKEQSDE